ncbi:PTS system mannose/fructose/sorbose family transporter subunit IID [Sporosalibacterium faouarense]|uniref:PTS system mannose/fructose/sorbose family transporter subunit IID n=1 Tax=Sporosalibacterium faouarense TaxID=516123 RepID=UPI00141CE07F|nr:PTS system mannose/fructose/sorbose family transporter subunit IID [Sporosalibacterium faouarense]MTI47127.1 PTS system mannose/fructose/sorbose family transporter subunit IID [Bacillota bacterium]
MPSTDMEKTTKTKIDKATLKKAMWRDIFTLQWSWNYERMQALGFLWAILPVLQKVYKKGEELKEAMQRHLQFYNTNPVASPLILGASIALEEDKAGQAASSIKVGLMGPLAGIGDTIQAVLFRPIIAVIAASLAMGGSMSGPLLIFLAGILWMAVKVPLFWLGYNKSTGLIGEVAGKGLLDKVTNTATIAGLIVIGGFIPSILSRLTTPLQFARTVTVDGEAVEKVIKVQEVLDGIVPFLIPVLIVGLGYYLIKRKLSPIKVLLILVALSFITNALGIL